MYLCVTDEETITRSECHAMAASRHKRAWRAMRCDHCELECVRASDMSDVDMETKLRVRYCDFGLICTSARRLASFGSSSSGGIKDGASSNMC